MKDWIRTALSIRKKRRPAPIGSLPPLGATILRGPVKMAVTQEMPADLWDWLVLSGWRNLPVKVDRRKGLRAPQDALRQLMACPPQERNRVHSRILEQARPEE